MERTHQRMRAPLAALACALLLAGSLLVGLPAGAAAPPRPLIELVSTQNTSTDQLGGSPILGEGDVLLVKAGQQVFGVVYGSERHPETPVTLFSLFTRSLGTATVRDENTGQLLARNVSMPIRTIILQRFDFAAEYRDIDGDGIFDYRPNRNTTDDPFDIVPVEPFFKGASLAGDWNLSGFSLSAASDDEVDAAFTLTLEGAPYRTLERLAPPGDGRLNEVAFTVHLKITRATVEAHDVPHYDATVDRSRGRRELTALEPAGTVNATFTSITAQFKVDHDIVGWDFAPPRSDVESRLLLHTMMAVVNAIDAQLADWLSAAALDAGRGGEATAPTESNGTVEINSSEAPVDFVRVRAITIGDHWRQLGGLGWTPTADIYANESSAHPAAGDVHFQVLGGGRVESRHGGALFVGFVLSGGYSYPAGYRIYHDPVLETSSVEVEPSHLGLWGALVIVGQIGAVAAAIIGVIALAAAASSRSARLRAQAEARRLAQLRERYKLPDPGSARKEVR